MDEKPFLALRYALAVTVIVCLSVGAYFFLSAGGSQSMTLWQFYPTGISAGLLILIELYIDFALSTSLCVLLVGISFVLFYFGFIEENPERKASLVGFAGAVFGFATGMPFGHFINSTKRKISAKPAK